MTPLRCPACGLSRKEPRFRYDDALNYWLCFAGLDVCFCFAWRGERVFLPLTRLREIAAPGSKLVQRE